MLQFFSVDDNQRRRNTQPIANTTYAIRSIQNALTETFGIATNRERTATMASTSAMMKVICVGALYFMLDLHSREGRDSCNSVTEGRLSGLNAFAIMTRGCVLLRIGDLQLLQRGGICHRGEVTKYLDLGQTSARIFPKSLKQSDSHCLVSFSCNEFWLSRAERA